MRGIICIDIVYNEKNVLNVLNFDKTFKGLATGGQVFRHRRISNSAKELIGRTCQIPILESYVEVKFGIYFLSF